MKETIKTEPISIDDIRPCDNCGGPIAPIFIVLDVRSAAFDADNLNSVLGTAQILGGINKPGAMEIAKVMSSGGDAVAKIIDEPQNTARIYLCIQCSCTEVCITELIGKRHDAQDKAEARRKMRETPAFKESTDA